MTTILIIAAIYCMICMIAGIAIAITTILSATKLLSTKKKKRRRGE